MKIVIVGTYGDFTKVLYNYISKEYCIDGVVLEENSSKINFLKRRIKKLGITKVFGQILFKIFIEKTLQTKSKSRIDEIMQKYNLDTKEIPSDKIYNVSSINSIEVINLLKEMNPDIILVMGTRIISEQVLQAVNCEFINMHMGITPLYRGVHGGYWALAENDKEHCGVTIHFVDKGIDTGKVIEQKIIMPDSTDNFVTYPLLQLGEGIRVLVQVLEKMETGHIETRNIELASKLRTHPTLWQYIYNYFKHGVK